MKRFKNDCRFSGKKILIADDCVEITKLISAVLAMTGAEVVEAFDGREALDKMTDNQFDMIMLDIHMPGVDGITAAKIMKNCDINRNCPVIIISSDHDRMRALSEDFAEIEGFIEKPFSSIDILNKMAGIFDPHGSKGSRLCLGDDCSNKNFKSCAVFNTPGFKLNLQGD